MKLKKLRVLSAALAASMILDMTGIQVLAQEAAPKAAAAEENTANDEAAEGETGIPDNDENASGGGNQIGGEGQEESEEEEPEGQEETEGENPEGQEKTEGEKPEGQEESEGEKPEGQEETEGENPEGQEESEAEKEADEAEETVSENSISENDLEEDENAGDFDMFPGLGHKLSAAQMADKETLSAHVGDTISDQNIKNDYKDAEGVYAPGVVVYTTDSQEEAEEVAAAFGGDLESYFCGVAVIDLADGVTVARAVCAAASEETNLPAVWPDYEAHLLNEEDAEEYVSEDLADEDATDDYSTDEYESYYQAVAVANDPALLETSIGYQWMHEYIGDSYAWAAGYKGQGIKVAVIDSGVRASHEDLSANVTGGWDCTGSTLTSFTEDRGTHGTHVAGIVAAQENNNLGGAGIAPDATITGFCVQGTDGYIWSSSIKRAVNAAVEKGYDIINMSLGSAWYEGDYAKVIKNAYESGVAVFASAGNEATNACNYPAAYAGVISIGAVDKNGAKAGFTNYGSTVDLAFPGVDIFSTTSDKDTTYAFMDGTSMACPAAAGTAAVILSADASIRSKSGKGRVDALLSAMKKSTTKCSGSGMGAGTTYLPGVLKLGTTQTAPDAPTIEIASDTYDAKKKVYRADSVTATIQVNTPSNVKIYYSLGSKKPSYKNGEVINGSELTVTRKLTRRTGTVALTGAKKVTVNAIAVNTITGKASKAASKTVTLAPTPTVVEITQANSITKVAAGKKVALKAEVTPSYAISTKVQWSILEENAQKAGINVSKGIVTTKKTTPAGSYTVVARAVGEDGEKYDGRFDTYVIQVMESDYAVKNLTFKPNKLTLNLGSDKTRELSELLEITLKNGTAEECAPELVWSSSDSKTVSVTKSGKVTAKAAGKATITVMANDGSGKKATCTVTVTSPVTGITLSGPAKVAAGKAVTLTATVTPATATNKKLNWTAEGNDKVTVQNGKVTAKAGAEGTCTVYAEAQDGSGTKSAGYTVTIVSGAITEIAMDQKTVTVFSTKGNSKAATSATINAVVKGKEGADLTAIQFTSSAPKVAAVTQNGTTATITAKTAGKATITCMATDGSGKKATCKVTVNVPMSSLSVAPASGGYFGYVAQGKSISLVAKYSSTFGTPTNKKIKWSSDNEAYVTVNPSNGKVTAKSDAPAGTEAIITATAIDGSGVKGSYTVTVTKRYRKLELLQASQNTFVVCLDREAGAGYYSSGLFDVQVSGAAGAGCNVVYDKNYGYLLEPVPAKVTYPYSSALPNYINSKYLQKMKITVTMKDGSNLKQTVNFYIARSKSGEICIYH